MPSIPVQPTFADESPEYADFLAKFKPKKTTDDCYTPPLVYEAVAAWVARRYDRDPAAFVRPFWPGGDYQRADYAAPGCTVVDNPPFSIITPIVEWYASHRWALSDRERALVALLDRQATAAASAPPAAPRP